MRIIIIVFLLILSSEVFAARNWYYGYVTRVAQVGSTDGSFTVTFDSSSLDDCSNKYVYFRATELGPERFKNAYSMALTSLTAKIKMGVVIDKAINGPGGICNAEGSTSDLVAN